MGDFFMKDEKLLNYIYQNVEMGILSIDELNGKIKDDKFLKLIAKQKSEYCKIKKHAMKLIKKEKFDLKEVNVLVKVSASFMSMVKINKSKKISHYAKLMIEGTNMGIIAITEKINNYDGIVKENIELANKLKQILEKNIDDLKKYL